LVIADPDESNKSAINKGIREGVILAEAANLARDMVNESPNYMTPADMADQAKSIANKYGLLLEVLERKQMEAMGMGALLGVAQGSQQPPSLLC